MIDESLKHFIENHLDESPIKLSNLLANETAERRTFVMQQINGRQKIKKKLPLLYTNFQLIIPPSLHLEQSSSEETAQFKASLFQGLKIIDITGGLGIDSFAFAENNQVTYCEINENLAEITQHNARVLDIHKLKVFPLNGIEFLQKTNDYFDLVYLDPARRDEQNSKVIKFEDCTPNILAIKEDLFLKSNKILMKTSPMFDLKMGIKQLKNVTKIYVVALKNEVKEILWLLEKDATIEATSVSIASVNLNKETTQVFEGTFHQESTTSINYGTIANFLYEPNLAIMKAGLFNLIAKKFNLKKLHQHSHLYTSEVLVENFPGRIFKVDKTLLYQPKQLKKILQKKKFNISTRNFPSLVRDLISKFQIIEGGEDFVFFTQQQNDEKIVIFTKKVIS